MRHNQILYMLFMLFTAIMLAGCTPCLERQNEDNENIDISVKVTPTAEPTVEPTVEPMADKREVQYVITHYQRDPDYYYQRDPDYYEKANLRTYTSNELHRIAEETVKRSCRTDDVTSLIPLYSYEDVLSLNFISDADKEKGKNGKHAAYIVYDWTHPYVYTKKPMYVMSVFYSMPYGAVEYDAASKTGYMMYDLDNGMRLYYMLKDMEGSNDVLNVTILGNPAVMAKRTSFAEFDGVLKDGATITELAQIDSVFNAYIDYMRRGHFYTLHGTTDVDETGNINDESYKRFIDGNISMDRPVSSVLILTDGVLKIFWDYVGDDYVVDRYEFREDFIIESYGIEVSYKIHDRYYVG